MELIFKKIITYPKSSVVWENNTYVSMSMNNKVFFSEKALISFLNFLTEKKTKITIINGDFLHRYNEQIFYNLTEKEAILKSVLKGHELEEKFINIAKKHFPNLQYNFVSSQEFTNHQQFEQKMEKFRKLLSLNSKFKELIEYTIDIFLRRQHNIKVYEERARHLCSLYLLEELVIFEILAEQGYLINIYPGNQLPIIKAICTGELPDISKPLEKIQAIEVKFRPKEQTKK